MKDKVDIEAACNEIPRQLQLFEDNDNELIVPRGFDVSVLGHVEIQDELNSHPVTINTTIKMRTYQERVVKLALHHGGGVIVAPTGAGKTTMGIELASRLGERW